MSAPNGMSLAELKMFTHRRAFYEKLFYTHRATLRRWAKYGAFVATMAKMLKQIEPVVSDISTTTLSRHIARYLDSKGIPRAVLVNPNLKGSRHVGEARVEWTRPNGAKEKDDPVARSQELENLPASDAPAQTEDKTPPAYFDAGDDKKELPSSTVTETKRITKSEPKPWKSRDRKKLKSKKSRHGKIKGASIRDRVESKATGIAKAPADTVSEEERAAIEAENDKSRPEWYWRQNKAAPQSIYDLPEKGSNIKFPPACALPPHPGEFDLERCMEDKSISWQRMEEYLNELEYEFEYLERMPTKPDDTYTEREWDGFAVELRFCDDEDEKHANPYYIRYGYKQPRCNKVFRIKRLVDQAVMAKRMGRSSADGIR